MALHEDDTFPLWSFAYMIQPLYDDNDKVMTSRVRTWEEAWTCIQHVGTPAFLEPEKVRALAIVRLNDKDGYCKTHRYDWLNEPPLWLKIEEGDSKNIW